MKKLLPMLLLGMLLKQAAIAQTHTVTGTVMDKSGNSLPFAFVEDSQYKYAAYCDSLGRFKITAHPDSKLTVDVPGYKDTLININNGTDIQIALKQTGSGVQVASASGSSGQQSDGSISRNEIANISNNMGGYLAPSHQKGDTRGSQYQFVTFVHGYVVNSSGDIMQKPNYLFDYDKMNGSLLLTRDNKTMVEVGWDETQSFSLFSNTGARVDFEKVPAIDQSHYVQVLASGKKYKICKLTKTTFVKSDYVNNGAAPHGHDYDEYVDDDTYYVVDVQSGQPQKFSLKKKSIKEAFPKEADKINKYLSDNSGRIDEVYISKLGEYMNN